MRKIGWNSQRDNFDFKGMFRGGSQCFSTCAWMFMSFFTDKYPANDDSMLSKYVDDVSDLVGSPGIGEIIKLKFRWITGNSAYWWNVQQAGIEKWLHLAGVSGRAVFMDGTCSWDKLAEVLKAGPVILQTNKMGGLRGGHIILIVDIEGDYLIANDPFGNALTGYSSKSGESVRYYKGFLKPYVGGEKLRCMWWDMASIKG